MEFCQQCDNMLYLRTNLEADGQSEGGGRGGVLQFYCKHCGFERLKTSSDDSCIYEMDYRKSNYAIHSVLNEYTYADPTLPRVDNVDCPNADCESLSNPDVKEICYIKYDQTQMKYVYLCVCCRTAWKIIGIDKQVELVDIQCKEVVEE